MPSWRKRRSASDMASSGARTVSAPKLCAGCSLATDEFLIKHAGRAVITFPDSLNFPSSEFSGVLFILETDSSMRHNMQRFST